MKLSPICWAAAFSAALPCRRALRRGPLAGTGAVQFCVKQSVLCFTLVCCVLGELCESLLALECHGVGLWKVKMLNMMLKAEFKKIKVAYRLIRNL